MAAPFLINRQQVALKLEATEGTDAVPGDADVIAPVFEPSFEPNFDMFPREVVQSSFSNLPQVVGQRDATITFSTEVKGSGTAGTPPVHLSAPFQACGLSETIVAATSVTYAPASIGIPSATVEIREGSLGSEFKSKKIIGARGTVIVTAVKGDVVLLEFTFTGRYVEPTDTTAFTTPSPGLIPVPFLDVNFSFLGTAFRVQTASLDLGNEVQLRNDVNFAAGHLSAVIVNRNVTAEIDPEQELIATENFYNDFINATEGILTWTLGSTAGNIVTFTANKAQIIELTEGDRESLRILPMTLQLNQDADAGDDELALVFT